MYVLESISIQVRVGINACFYFLQSKRQRTNVIVCVEIIFVEQAGSGQLPRDGDGLRQSHINRCRRRETDHQQVHAESGHDHARA